MQDRDLVMQFVQLCAIEIKFLYGCSVLWDKPTYDGSEKTVSAYPSPRMAASTGPCLLESDQEQFLTASPNLRRRRTRNAKAQAQAKMTTCMLKATIEAVIAW